MESNPPIQRVSSPEWPSMTTRLVWRVLTGTKSIGSFWSLPRFYENELKREQQVNQRIEKIMLQKAQITEEQLKKAQAQVERMAAALERSRDLSRVIVHVDMDAFYAAVEMRDCPELKDKPMAVGSMSMLSTSNYHARKYGVRAAMPGFIAKKLCPNLVIVPTNFDKYRAVSEEIREIFADYDPHFQPMSLDEAYLDFTEHLEQRQSWPDSARTHHYRASNKASGDKQKELPQQEITEMRDFSPVLFEDSPTSSPDSKDLKATHAGFEVFGSSVEEAVREMRFRIEQKTMLTASAGIAPNTMLAKVCSDKNKPNGQYRLPPTRGAVMDFVQNLPVRKVSGIGKVSEKMLNALGVTSCSDLSQQMALLSLLFSETAWHHFMQVSLGLSSTYIPRHEERKSMSTERTFKELSKVEEQLSLCRELCEDLAADMKKENLKGKTVTLKLKNVNFEVKTRAMTVPYAVATVDEIFAVAKDLLKTEIDNESPQPLRLRLMGVRISAFVSADDKKPLQKSILGFLQPGKAGSSGLTQGVNQNLEKENLSDHPSTTLACPPLVQNYKQKEVPVWEKQRLSEGNQTSKEPKQSFFHRAHAERLKIQAANAKTQEEEHEENTSAIPSTGLSPHNQEEASTETHKESSALSDESENEHLSLVEACASTSGCGGKATETLTCPVCFQRVETTDLSVFNKHIDQCLSDPSRKPNQCSISDSDSDIESQRDQKGGDVGDESRGDCVIVKATNSKALESNTDVPGDKQIGIKNNSKTGLLIKYENKTVTLQQSQPFSEKGSILICPVCQLTQDSDDLVIFNHHVDLCLNKPVLHKLRGWTSSPMIPPSVENKTTERGHILPSKANKGKSKRRDTPSSPPSKKAKSAGPLNTIDKFFR
ncbi:DNA polymerase kappa isoform X2 [Cheilinus undulatus]|uniref:DNA polymerase kappa isoform X2 n=1 Tax=Cheilinus undulatus TaxID=241271 RepID=UPI001BD461D2|nr:DNA polymerase kappa isoform X2 [Cheilinus undulatus]